MLSPAFTQNELKLNQLKHKQLPPHFHFATRTHGSQIKPVHYLVKQKTLLRSQKDDCHPVLADFGNDQFCIHFIDEGANIIFIPLESLCLKLLNHFKVNIDNQSRKILNNYYNNLQIRKILISLILITLIKKDTTKW